jgi:hypothetical protein
VVCVCGNCFLCMSWHRDDKQTRPDQTRPNRDGTMTPTARNTQPDTPDYPVLFHQRRCHGSFGLNRYLSCQDLAALIPAKNLTRTERSSGGPSDVAVINHSDRLASSRVLHSAVGRPHPITAVDHLTSSPGHSWLIAGSNQRLAQATRLRSAQKGWHTTQSVV